MNQNSIIEEEQIVNGVKLHYKIAGSGDPLLLLHGSPLTSRSWLRIMPQLAETYTVIAPDLRGYGESDRPASGYEIHTMVEDVRQLMRSLEIERVNVVGHDLGGIVAYVYAANYMDEVRRLGIIESPIIGVPSPIMEGVLAGYWHIGFYAHPRLPELLIGGREKEYLAEFIHTYQLIPDAFTEEDLIHYAGHLASPEGIRGAMGVYREILSELPKILQLTKTKLTMPVWAVGGDHSMGLGPLEQFRQLAEMAQGGVVTDSGHWVIEEQPAKVIAQLEAFLR